MAHQTSTSQRRILSQICPPSSAIGFGLLLKPPASFHVVKAFEFYQEESYKFRADITVVENTPYVALSSWWLNRMSGAWLPTGKQFLLSTSAWFGLASRTCK